MRTAGLLLGVLAVGLVDPVLAQQVNLGNRFNNGSSSFFENFGTSWGLNIGPKGSFGGGQFRFNGGANAVPQFGNFRPGAGLNGGFSTRRGRVDGFLTFEASQGSTRALVSQGGSLTVINGQSGFVADTIQSPFVISTIPIVGDPRHYHDFGPANTVRGRMLRGELSIGPDGQLQAGPQTPSHQGRQAPGGQLAQAPAKPLVKPAAEDALVIKNPAAKKTEHAPLILRSGGNTGQRSSADQGADSLEQLHRQQAEEEAKAHQAALQYWQQGQRAEQEGKPQVARVYYRLGLKKAPTELRQQFQQRLEQLSR